MILTLLTSVINYNFEKGNEFKVKNFSRRYDAVSECIEFYSNTKSFISIKRFGVDFGGIYITIVPTIEKNYLMEQSLYIMYCRHR